MQCPECGSEINESLGMCPACGAQLSTATTSSTAGTNSRSLVSRHLERILLFGGIFIVLVGAIVLYLTKWDPSNRYAGKPIDHPNIFVALLLICLVSALLATIVSAQHGRLPFIRKIPGLNAIDEAVGRATEMGRPILFSPGLHGLDIVTLQALAVASHVGKKAVKYGTRLIVPVCDSQIMPVTEQMMREVYTSEGHPEAYRAEDIRFLSDRQFAYAAGVTGILHRERVAASFLFGAFFAESLILAENGQAVGAIQVAGTPDLLQIPFFVVTCDYTIIGDEYYAASAYLTREPTQLGSLVGQDIGKAMLFALIVIGVVWGIFTPHSPVLQWLGGGTLK
ncbi:MAG TPA: DUF6754 domain-containing protein [Armatimonadota bacterium]|nr:DUF6754 domain-containing protein [Armatimonadota bacterium]